ncbi:uncharacterized protein [Epargyreus clarus]|uniref:uncharacterized protein n=1 Tax=Epargyreus clarus TaxID=520877 RepID=UPI003C30989E
MFLCFSIILSVFFDTATCITAPSVKIYYVALNEDHCLITDKRMHAKNILNGTSKTHFLIDRAVPCLPDMTNAFDLTVPEHMKVNFVVKHNLKERLCNVEQSTVFYYKCYFNFNFQGGNDDTTQATTGIDFLL